MSDVFCGRFFHTHPRCLLMSVDMSVDVCFNLMSVILTCLMSFVEDSFIRTQDDSSYVGGRGIHRSDNLNVIKNIIIDNFNVTNNINLDINIIMFKTPIINLAITIRVVYWNDANGSTFVMAKIGNEWFEDHDIIVEDCTVSIDIAIIATINSNV